MKSNDKNLTPQLRFKDFKNSGEWEEKTLGEISSIIKEKLGKNNYTLLSITAGYGLVSQLEKFGKEIAGSSYENYIVIYKYDFAYNKSATKDYQSGYVALLKTYDVAAVPNSIFLCFRVDETILNVFFLEQLFKFNYHDKYLRKLIQIGARAHGSLNISNKDFFSMPIPIPPLKEQQKIADFLSSVDELLELEKIKLEKLKEYKKGLLQNLFPKENQNVPDLRFPEFKNSGEWEETKLKEISEITTGNKNVQDKVEDGIYPFFVRSDNIEKINTYSYDGEAILTAGDGRIGEIFHYTNGKFDFHQRVYMLSNFKTNIYAKYVYYIFSRDFKKRALSMSAKNTVDSVRMDMISEMEIFIPYYNEQQKIADFLLSVDELILGQTKKIEIMREYKKGLLQQTFPNQI